jgi:hypothetical protein
MALSVPSLPEIGTVAGTSLVPPLKSIIEGKGTIQYVSQANCVTVVGDPTDGRPPEMVVSFEGVDAPRMRSKGQSDPLAYAMREILRKFCHGKTCSFSTTNDLPRVFFFICLSSYSSQN